MSVASVRAARTQMGKWAPRRGPRAACWPGSSPTPHSPTAAKAVPATHGPAAPALAAHHGVRTPSCRIQGRAAAPGAQARRHTTAAAARSSLQPGQAIHSEQQACSPCWRCETAGGHSVRLRWASCARTGRYLRPPTPLPCLETGSKRSPGGTHSSNRKNKLTWRQQSGVRCGRGMGCSAHCYRLCEAGRHHTWPRGE
jgi:hypothetical protein